MRSIRFNHVYLAILLLSALCAFVIPTRVSDAVRGSLTLAFYPVARPVNSIATWIGNRIAPEKIPDDGATDPAKPREMETILSENQLLRVQVASLRGQLARQQELEAQRESVGEVRRLCEPFKTVGPAADPVMREALLVAGTTTQGVRQNMPVLYGGIGGGGIAGRVERAQIGGSMVRLITDRGFRVTIGFARFKTAADGKLDFVRVATPSVLAEGDGDGSMWIRTLKVQDADAASIAPGDWVVLNDSEWPDALQWYRLGRVVQRQPYAKGPGFTELQVRPATNLRALSEVLVMIRAQ